MAEIIKETTITTGEPEGTPNTSGNVVVPVTPITPKVEKSRTVEYLIYFFFGIIEILLAFRLVFKITGANPISGFVSFIYALTQIFVMPFVGIFPAAVAPGATTTAVLEPSTLVAMAVYAVLAWIITELVAILSRRPKE